MFHMQVQNVGSLVTVSKSINYFIILFVTNRKSESFLVYE